MTQNSQFTVASASVTNHTLISAVAVQDVNSAVEVTEGHLVKAIWIERWIVGDAASESPSFVSIVAKVPAEATLPTFTNMTTLDAYPNKKNILYTTQGLIAQANDNPTPIIRQWIKIPKGKQRFGLGDKLVVSIAAIGSPGLIGCGIGIYKSYS